MLKREISFRRAYLYCAFVTLIPYIAASLFQKQREEDFIFVLVNTAIYLTPVFFLRKARLYTLAVFSALFIAAFVDFVHVLLFQAKISQNTFFIILDTNIQEGLEFLGSNLIDPKIILISLAYLLVSSILFFIILRAKRITQKIKFKKFALLVFILPFALKVATTKADFSKTWEAYRRGSHLYTFVHSFGEYKKQMSVFSDLAGSIQKDMKVDRVNLESSSKKEVHVLVIGESTTSAHMQIYGYSRETTPKLESLRGETNFFSQTKSSYPPYTRENLKKILTFANSEDESEQKLYVNIINIMKQAGFKTYWLSNQVSLSEYDTMTTVFAKQADVVHFTNTSSSTSYDEKVLPFFTQFLKDSNDKKFFVLHLLGSHMKYRYRFPDQFARFKEFRDIKKMPFHNNDKLQYINDYDNSVLYQDHILFEVLSHIKGLRETNSSVTFLSDHGEEVYMTKDLHGHNASRTTESMFKIPLIIWTSDKRMFTNELDRKYVSDDLIHTLLDLWGIRTKGYEAQRSLINSEFEQKEIYESLK